MKKEVRNPSWFEKLMSKLFRYRDITSAIDGVESLYLRRYYIFRTPWFGVFVHLFNRSDADRHLHDHPWNFFTFVLWNGYYEQTPTGVNRLGLGSWKRHKAEDSHKVTLFDEKPSWTLFLRGKNRRDWGFHTDKGWVDWRDYLGFSPDLKDTLDYPEYDV